MLESGNLTTRHRRYLTRDIPEKVVDEAENLNHEDVDIPIHDEFTESEVQTDRGVVTRSMKKRRHANSAHGKFHGERKSVSEG